MTMLVSLSPPAKPVHSAGKLIAAHKSAIAAYEMAYCISQRCYMRKPDSDVYGLLEAEADRLLGRAERALDRLLKHHPNSLHEAVEIAKYILDYGHRVDPSGHEWMALKALIALSGSLTERQVQAV